MFNGYEFGDQGEVARFEVPPFSSDDPTLIIEVEKVGGGTIGEEYEGDWNVRLTTPTGITEDVISTGLPHTHRAVAGVFADFQAHPGGADCGETGYGYQLCQFEQEEN